MNHNTDRKRVAVVRPFYHVNEHGLVDAMNRHTDWAADLLVCQGNDYSDPIEGPRLHYFRATWNCGNYPFSLQLVRHLLKQRYDVVNVVEVFQPLSLAVLLLFPLRAVVTVKRYEDRGGRAKTILFRIILALMRSYFRRRGMVIAISRAARDYHDSHGWRPRRIERIPIGIDETLFRPIDVDKAAVRSRYDCPTDVPLILEVARFVPFKNIDRSIRLIGAIRDAGRDVHLLVVGRGPDEPRIRALIEEMSLSDRITIVERVPHGEVPRLISASDAFLLLSALCIYEAAALEAVACGVPVIVSDVGAFRDYVTPDVGRRLDLDGEETSWLPEIFAVLDSKIPPAGLPDELTWSNLAPRYAAIFDVAGEAGSE